MAGIVRYARLVNLGNYENERLELEDFPRPEETLEQAYQRVREWVHQQLGIENPLRDLEARLLRIKGDIFAAEDKMRRVRQRWVIAAERYEELHTLLAAHGVTLEALPSYLVPTPEPAPEPVGDEHPF